MVRSFSLARAFVAELRHDVVTNSQLAGLEAELRGCVERGRAALPEAKLDPDAFAAHLGGHCAEPTDLNALQAEDLYLACACAHKDKAALAELLSRLEAVGDRIAGAGAGDDADEIRLAVTQRLVMGDPPKISAYAGRGTLSQWLAAAMAREQISRRRTAARRQGLLQHAATELAPADPELAFLKTHYRAEFKAAFGEALAALDPKDQTVLRHRFVDELTLEQLAVACGIHRATAARALARIRASLLTSTRERLHVRLRIEGAEIDSVVRLIASNFDVSVQRLLS